jgi:protein-S-isoprenylcysteine O-methyltransferase Ste14
VTDHAAEKTRLSASGISYVNRMVGTSIAPACAFFTLAWRVDIIQAWVYFGLFVLLGLSNIALLARYNMELLNERGKTQADVHRSEKVITPLFLLFTHVIAPAVAGIEVGRLHTEHQHVITMGAGIALLVVAGLLENWATYVNRFYERSIRLQTDRHQTVVSNGPYSFVRHPGYLSYILKFAALPLALGSVYAIIPIAAGILVMAIRTKVEDTLLMGNLPGYKEYARKVRYRLFPPLW